MTDLIPDSSGHIEETGRAIRRAESAAFVTDISRKDDPEQRARDWVKATQRFTRAKF
jgi:hypothetical protein